MPDGLHENGDASDSPIGESFYYTVLNLPPTASDQEIRDRYRQLSVVFHPDKQHNDETKATATKRFLEIQKAYEVLSDPVSRRAYDALGAEGLKLAKSADLSNVPYDQIEHALKTAQQELERARVEGLIRSKGRMTIGVDASSLFEEDENYFYGRWDSLGRRILTRVNGIHRDRFSIRHSINTKLSPQTSFVLTGAASTTGANLIRRGTVSGTIRHQYSPRLNFEGTASLLGLTPLKLRTTFNDSDNTISLGATIAKRPLSPEPALPSLLSYLPGLNATFSRRLFKNSPLQGNINAQWNGMMPITSISLSSGALFDVSSESALVDEETLDLGMRPPSPSGLARGVRQWTLGLNLAGLQTSLSGQVVLGLLELGVTCRAAVELGILTGLSWVFGGEWRRDDKAVGASVALGLEGVTLNLELAYLGQSYSIPICLSHEREPFLALLTGIVPSATLAFSYAFILRPRQRRRRLEYFKKVRRELREDKADLLRESKETTHLLQETARRHMQAETACDGLTIQEATYGPAERDEGTEGLDVDVTVPLQALVSKSQVYIPRGDKAGLQGFYDPVPAAAKTLRVRYTFRGRTHYAEIPDYKPVVLPLEEHLVESDE
ncbi:hypothetical protein CERSUDRAFT_116966 [Gelatoporia subvermispora B]|uniref:J domain-containing protein n=1 Tax=Ceriporiopsis subvermispora (strain B) TaxID=914234 RepID=M2R8K9_CERS8|nr:hypothetical protein CERSUDRAFT_116966 [Gelatoporia subvermispora B]